MPKLAAIAPALGPPKVSIFREIYNVPFHGSLNPTLDPLHIGPLEFTTPPPVHSFVDDELVQGVKLQTNATGAAIAGVYAAGRPATFPPSEPPELPFDTRAPFMLQGVYRAPSGPTNGTWAVGILAAGGGSDQVIATLQFNPTLKTGPAPGTARLNLPQGATAHTPQPLPQAVYNEIVVNRTPFTLALFIDRISGQGSANLTVLNTLPPPPPFPPPAGNPSFSIADFTLADFQPTSGPEINTVGTVVANVGATGVTVHVTVTDFRIYMVAESV